MSETTGIPIAGAAGDVWQLRLYIAGQSPRSLHALANVRVLCDEYLPESCVIEIIDLVDRPSLARDDDILAIPTLVRCRPLPVRKIIGDLSDRSRVLVGLQIRSESSP